jgi:hypothetical protein
MDEPRAEASSSNQQRMEDEVRDHADAEMARRVLRKIDWTLIPILFVTYMLNFMDKTILSSAAVFGLREDNVSPTPTGRSGGMWRFMA